MNIASLNKASRGASSKESGSSGGLLKFPDSEVVKDSVRRVVELSALASGLDRVEGV